LEKRDATTLDRIICDPERAAEFDLIAADIAPGYSSLEYRWAALSCERQGFAAGIVFTNCSTG